MSVIGTAFHLMSGLQMNTLGLSLDIVGVIMLFCYGLPPKVFRKGVLTWRGATEKEERRSERLSYVALVLLVVGFALQLWAGFLS